MTRLPPRIVWREGLLMAPQHLQHTDARHEAAAAHRLESSQPDAWGVVRIELDRKLLATGQVLVTDLEAVLPGGLVVQFRAGDPGSPASRAVHEHFPPNRTTLGVWVGVPCARPGFANYAARSGGRERFVTRTVIAPEATGTGPDLEIEVAEPNATVLFDTESRDGFDAVRVAEIARDETGEFVVVEPYVPPCLRISASSFLTSSLRRVFALMGSRRRALEESRRERDGSTVEYGPADVTRFLLLASINTYIPVVAHMIEAGDTPPRALFLVLSQLAGQLSTFSSAFDPATLPAYQYNDLRATFEVLVARITSLLHASVREQCISLDLDADPGGYFTGRLDDERWHTCGRFFVGIRSNVGEQVTAMTLPRLSKLASWTDLNEILHAATPGAPIEVVLRPPPELPLRAGTVYFAIATDNPFFRNVLVERTVALYAPTPFDPQLTRIQLIGLLGRPSA